MCGDVRRMTNMMEGFMNQQGQARPGGRVAAGAAAPGGSGDNGPKPAFRINVDADAHDELLPLIGITQARAEAQEIKAECPLNFGEWWGRVQRLKGMVQWRKKLVNLGASQDTVKDWVMADIGRGLFQHLDEEGAWHANAIQESPP